MATSCKEVAPNLKSIQKMNLMNRRRFSLGAVASSDGTHTRISHDRKAGTTGRTERRQYVRCGNIKLAVTPMQAAMLAPMQRITIL